MSIHITGDTHGEMSMNRFSHKKWPKGKTLTKNDYLIIAGDFGLIYRPEQTSSERWWLNWLDSNPWTTLFVDGNHENHEKLNALPLEPKFGGIVGRVSDSIFHLKRGEVYQIQDKKILTFGGAQSIDKENRLDGISWWKEEIPNYKDMDNCIENMKKHQYDIDIIIAHQCPLTLVRMLSGTQNLLLRETDPTCKMLEHIVTNCKFSEFFCGHWHLDIDHGKYHFLYNRIVAI